MNKPTPKSRVTGVTHVHKADTTTLIVNGSSFPEDAFAGSYMTGGNDNTVAILEPSYKPGTLQALSSQNNTLGQCIAAMEVNIDGTGHSIDLLEHETEDETQRQILDSFFKEPYPGQTMVSIRRQLRVDMESTGTGYLEAIRNAKDELVLLTYIDANNIRMIRYDAAVPVTKEIERVGKPVKVTVSTRERRFVQQVNGTKTYFKEFGASRDLDRETGKWAPKGGRLPIDKRASEILYFTVNKDAKSPYGLPRWLNQLPSVLGSRKAEEFNLEFFDAGGLPPVLILVQGGYLGDDVKDTLVEHLSNTGNKHRAVVVEAISSSGSMESAGAVQVKVERFGSDRMSDAMFQNYDKNTEEHVRTAFRLPPMFIGKSQDYNFATAYTAYMVAEAQVFYPERDEFDMMINATVVKALGVTKYAFRSLPLTLIDVANQLKALELVADKDISGEEKVSVLNEITGLSLTYEKQEAPTPPVGKTDPLTGLPYTQPAPPPPHQPSNAAPAPEEEMQSLKAEVDPGIVTLAAKWSSILGLDGPDTPVPASEQAEVRKAVGTLVGTELKVFNEILASHTLLRSSVDTPGLGELCACANHLQG